MLITATCMTYSKQSMLMKNYVRKFNTIKLKVTDLTF
jgi:hypothetical protein